MDLTGILVIFGLLVIGVMLYQIFSSREIAAKKPVPLEVPVEDRSRNPEMEHWKKQNQDGFEIAEPIYPVIEFPPEPVEEYVPELPKNYNDTGITIMARDPNTLYIYWDISQERLASLRESYGQKCNNSVPVIRIYDITGLHYFNGKNSNSYQDIIINDYCDSWYFNLASPSRTYCAELGRLLDNGTFVFIARSNGTTTPRASMSDKNDPEWMLVDEDQKKLYGRISHTDGMSSYQLFKQN